MPGSINSIFCEEVVMVKILADSTCDLSPALISKYKIGIIPKRNIAERIPVLSWTMCGIWKMT